VTKRQRTKIEECQEGEKKLFSRNPLNCVIEILERKECMESRNPLRINIIRDITFISVDEIQELDLYEEKRSKPLKIDKSSKSEEIISSGGGVTVVIGSQCKGSTTF
jgi:hypothetical protein